MTHWGLYTEERGSEADNCEKKQQLAGSEDKGNRPNMATNLPLKKKKHEQGELLKKHLGDPREEEDMCHAS